MHQITTLTVIPEHDWNKKRSEQKEKALQLSATLMSFLNSNYGQSFAAIILQF